MAALTAAQRRAVGQALGWMGEGNRLDQVPPDLYGPVEMCIRMRILSTQVQPGGWTAVWRTSGTPPDPEQWPELVANTAGAAKRATCPHCGERVLRAKHRPTGGWADLTPTPWPGGTCKVENDPGGVPRYVIVHWAPQDNRDGTPLLHAYHAVVCAQPTLI